MKHFTQLVKKIETLFAFCQKMSTIFRILSEKVEQFSHIVKKLKKFRILSKKVKHISHLVKKVETLFASCQKN